MRYVIGLTAAILTAMPAFAADAKFALTGENTTVKFVGTKADGKHEGGFKKLAGTASVTGTDAATAKIEVTIETDSLWSDDAKLTGHLKSPDFFDVKTNPMSKFVSSKIEKATDGYTVTGDLTLNGKTKSISFPAKITAAEGAFTLTSEFKLDRTAFGMSYGKGKINDEVQLTLKVSAKQ